MDGPATPVALTAIRAPADDEPDSARSRSQVTTLPAVLSVTVQPQPDPTTCGPTCLQAVYGYYGDEVPLDQVVSEVPSLPGGGTLAVHLACHALRRGYTATILTYNLTLFDPTWFADDAVSMTTRLEAQRRAKPDPKLSLATDAYLEFFALGGALAFEDLRPSLLRRYLTRGVPLLTGLSATYLYQCAREHGDEYDDVRGEPTGHFVVLSGYDRRTREVVVADPLHDNPGFGAPHYPVGIERLLASILLGIVTYDANLLVIEPRKARG
jgi:hypothetical protein